MNRMFRIAVMIILGVLPSLTLAEERPSDIIQMGAYVATDKLADSESFYTALFGAEPTIKLDNFIAYDIAGGIFAIAQRGVYAPTASPGSGAVPYIHSTELSAVAARFELATGVKAPEIIVEPGIQILKVMDPNGQLVEFFSFTN